MAQDNATVNLFINNEQAKESIDELRSSWNALRKARKEAETAGNTSLQIELAAQEKAAKRQYDVAKKLKYDIEKVLNNVTTISLDDLYATRKQLNSQIKILGRDTDEYKTKLQQLSKVEHEIASASTRRLSLMERFKQGAMQFAPALGIGAAIGAGLNVLKQGIAEIWALTKTIQGESKRAGIVFGDELGRVEMQAEKLASKAGLTAREMVAMASATADLLIPLGFARDVSADMSLKVQTLAGALDEWTAGKFGADEISRRLTKAMLGETESLESLGIAIRLDSEEYKNLIKQKLADGAASTGQAQAMAILDLLYQKSADARAAYVSGGNELLRFQKSASLGWRQMKESIAEWFATTYEERVQKQARSFQALDKEFKKNQESLNSLIPTYKELSVKANLNASEQERLRSAIDGIVGIVPSAATGFDKYGRALGVNTAVVEAAMEAQRLLRLEMSKEVSSGLKNAARDQQMALVLAESELKKREKAVSNYTEMAAKSGMNLSVKITEANNALDEQKQYITGLNRAFGETIISMEGFGYKHEEIASMFKFGRIPKTTQEIKDLAEAYTIYQNSLKDPNDGGGTTETAGLIAQAEAALKTAREELANLTDEAAIAAKNAEISKLEKEAKRLQGLGVVEEPKETTPKEYSLSADKEYMTKKLELKQKLQAGEIASEEEHNKQLLALEISILEARISSGKEKGETLLKLEQELADKRYSQKKDEDEYNKKLLAASYEGEPAVVAETRAYETRLRELGIFGIKREDLTEGQLAALLNLEKQHQEKLSAIRISLISDGIEKQKKAIDQRISTLRIASNNELAEANTFEKKKQLLRRWFSDDELRGIRKDKNADDLLKKKFAQIEEEETKKHYEKLLTFYKNFTTEFSAINPFGPLLNMSLTDEERKAIEAKIQELEEIISKLGINVPTAGGAEEARDILGFTSSQWTEMFGRLKEGQMGLEDWRMILDGIGNAFGEISNVMTAVEQRSLKEFTKSQNKKKQALDRQLKAGVISQEQHSSKVQAIDEETEAKREELDRKRATREKLMSIFQAIINTAVGVTSALAQGPYGIALAAVIGAIGAAQVGTILATPLPGAEEGGYLDVERTQDGKHFRAKSDPSARGAISKPTILVGENGTEYVVPNEGYDNPTIRPVLDIIECARRSGSLATINLPAIMQSTIQGRQSGGYASKESKPIATTENAANSDDLGKYIQQLVMAIELLNKAADVFTTRPIKFIFAGRNGFDAAYTKFKNTKDNAHL